MSDYRTTTGEPLPAGTRQKRRWRQLWLKRALWVLPVVLLSGFIIPVQVRIPATGYITTDDYAEVRPAATGPVAEILIPSGARVKQGDLLVRLNDSVERAAFDEAVSDAQRAEAQLAYRQAELEQEKRQRNHLLEQAELRTGHAATILKMTEDLHTKGLASGKILENEKTDLALARSDYDRLRDRDETLADKELEVLRRELAVKQSAVTKAEAQLSSRHVNAPISGETVRYEFVIGELITPQSVLYEIFGGSQQILKLRIPERYAAQVTAGAPYKAVLSIYTGIGRKRFSGTVTALRAVIQTDSDQTYRMAYCTFDDRGLGVPPGTSAEARVTVARVPFWFWMFGVR